MSGPGGASWDTATPLTAGTSTPTPITSLVKGDAFPYYPAWWTFTATQDGGFFLNTSGSTADPGRWTDNYIWAYAGTNQATTTQVADGYESLELNCVAGETYHIKVGCWDDVGDSGLQYILEATPYVYTDWVDVPDLARSESRWVGNITVTNGVDVNTDSVGPSSSTLSSVMLGALAPTSTVSLNRDGSVATAGPGVTGTGSFQGGSRWTYSASAGVRKVAGSLAQPSRYISSADYADVTPPGALGIEVASEGVGELVSTSISYTLTESSFDSSTGIQQNASGSWSYVLTVPSNSATLTGPFVRNSVTPGSVSTPSVAADATIPVSAEILFGSAAPADSAFPSGGSVRAAGQWAISVTLHLRRPQARFKVPPPSDTTIAWWDGTARQPATVVGWWDGSASQTATLRGYWDGTSIQPITGS